MSIRVNITKYQNIISFKFEAFIMQGKKKNLKPKRNTSVQLHNTVVKTNKRENTK